MAKINALFPPQRPWHRGENVRRRRVRLCVPNTPSATQGESSPPGRGVHPEGDPSSICDGIGPYPRRSSVGGTLSTMEAVLRANGATAVECQPPGR